MASKRFNLVTFKPEGSSKRIYLSLEGEFVLSAGLKPNVNRAKIPFTQFDLLKTASGGFLDAGTVEFWHSREPDAFAAPDVSLDGWRIVDMEATDAGIPRGQKAPRITEFRLHLADARERFVHPKGGLLSRGDVNGSGVKKEELVRNSILIRWCLEAMGIAVDGIPEDLDAIEPARGLQWNGAHAPAELQKLLDHCFAAFLVTPSGGYRIEMMGSGVEPSISPGKEVGSARLPGLGRRGKTIVIASAPHPIVDTLTLSGPSPDKWEFVVRGKLGYGTKEGWHPIEAYVPDKAGGKSAASESANLFFGVTDPDERAMLMHDAWRFVRLSDKVFSSRQSPGLRILVNDDGTTSMPKLKAMAALPYSGDNGEGYTTPATLIDVPIESILHDPQTGQVILSVSYPLGKVAVKNSPFFWAQFLPLKDGELSIEMSFEASAGGLKDYFMAAYRLAPKGLEKLNESEMQAVVEKPDRDVVFLSRRELRLRRRDGQDVNRKDVDSRAKTIAEQYLAGSQDDYVIRIAAGFVPAWLSGRLAEIRYSQDGLKTTFKVNSWHYPLQAASNRESLQATLKEAFQGQAQSHQERVSSGGAGEVQPVVPVMAGASGGMASESLVIVKITGTGQGGKFTGQIGRGACTAVTAGNLAMPEGMTFDEQGTCLVLSIAENGMTVHHWIGVGSYVLGKIVGRTTPAPGVPIVMALGNRDGLMFAVRVEKTGGIDGTRVTYASWTYTVKDYAGAVTLGTGLSPECGRPLGKRAYGQGTGVAFYIGTVLHLWDAGEHETTGGCQTGGT